MDSSSTGVWQRQDRSGIRRLDLRFQPALEAEFERDTARTRRYAFRRIGHIQLVTSHLAAIGLYALLGDLIAVAIATFAVDLFGFVCALILFRKPGVFLRESAMLAMVLAWVVMAEILSLRSSQNHLWVIQTAIAVQPFLIAAGLQLRFNYCVVGCAAIVVCVVLGNALFSHVAAAEQFWMAVVQTAAAIYALFGCWKLEYRERSNYLAIRESQDNARQLDQANTHLAQLTYYDELTGALNRRGLKQRFVAECLGQPVGVILIDVDYFKRFNDHYGHMAGDTCLRQIADRLSHGRFGDRYRLARWGGEEFIALARVRRAEDCAAIAERMRADIEIMAIEHLQSAIAAHVTITAGYALSSSATTLDLDDLINRADRALYGAKKAGRNRVYGESGRLPDDNRSRPQRSQIPLENKSASILFQ